jgi:hypothetical protein
MLRVLSAKEKHQPSREWQRALGCNKSKRGFSQADQEHGTHLTVNWGVEIKKNEVSDYSREGCHARKGVDLPKAKISSPTVQKPGIFERGDRHYRPRSSTGSGDVLG